MRARFTSLAVALASLLGEAGGRAAATPASATVSSPSSVSVSSSLPQLAQRRGAAPEIDGVLDDAAWSEAAVMGAFTQFMPDAGAPATEGTEVRMLIDGEALYVAAQLRDARVAELVHPLTRRDSDVVSDWFFLGIDGDVDRRTGFAFGINPSGVKQDAYLYDDVKQDLGWDGVWEGAARVDARGWTAELRIPLSQIDLGRAGASGRVLALNVSRLLARRFEQSFWAVPPRDGTAVVSAFREVQLPAALEIPRRIELVPYTLGRVAMRGWGDDASPAASLGLDLRYRRDSRLQINASINPDFGQVEADPAVVNLTAFETLVRERRPLFADSVDRFGGALELGGDSGERLFYSRRIGRPPGGGAGDGAIEDAPEATTIVGAAKILARPARGVTLGVVEAVTSEETGTEVTAEGERRRRVVEPWTNYLAMRAAVEDAAGRSTLAATYTDVRRASGADTEGMPRDASAGGLDGRHRFLGEYEARGHLLGSLVHGSAAAIDELQRAPTRYWQRPDADHVALRPDARSLAGYDAMAKVAKVGGHLRWLAGGAARSPGFEINDAGFQLQADRLRQIAAVAYDQYLPGPQLQSWRLELTEESAWTYGGERTGTRGQLAGTWQLPSYWSGSGSLAYDTAATSVEALRGGPALELPATISGSLQVASDPRRRVTAALYGSASNELELAGWSAALTADLTVQPINALMLVVSSSHERGRRPWQYVAELEVDERPRYLVGDLRHRSTSLTGRAVYTLSPRLSLQLYVQPFWASGSYARLGEVVAPSAARPADRVRYVGEIGGGVPGVRGVDLDRDGVADAGVAEPDYSVMQLRSTAVLRWEWRLGSELFAVWTHHRASAADAQNAFLIKLSFWTGL